MFFFFFLNHWMGEILENILNSVTDKLNFILQPLLCLLIRWLPNWLPGEGAGDRCVSIIPPSQVGA